MAHPEARNFLDILFSPLEEISKSSRIVLVLSTGELALLVVFSKEITRPGWQRLAIIAVIVILAFSILEWLRAALSLISFRQSLSKALSRLDLDHPEPWIRTEGEDLVRRQGSIVKFLTRQCWSFFIATAFGILYLLALFLPPL